MAAVTSLPELVTGASAVAAAGAPDLAVGDVLGSCAFNLVLISLLDLLYATGGRGSVFDYTSRAHIISGAFGVVLLGVALLGIQLRPAWAVPYFGHVGVATLLLALLYVVAVWSVFGYERSAAAEKSYTELYGDIPLAVAVRGYALSALVVVVSGAYLPFLGKQIVAEQGWSGSLVGTLFIAWATSLPEVFVTLGAARLGAIDLAVGNILGSNLFNMLILFTDDLLYLRGPLLAEVAPVNAITATVAMMMTGLTVVGIVLRPRRAALLPLSWIALGILALFALNVAVLARSGA
jgi:cation:H+ antiporter